MQAYSEILPPTAVTHAVRLSLTGRKAHNLVVAKTSLLQIFDTKVSQSRSPPNGNNVNPNSPNAAVAETDASQNQTKLVLLAEYQLSGTITSLAPVKLINTKSGGQALLISLKDARISLVEWDPEAYGISTISIHLYEGDDLQNTPWAPSLAECPSFLTVDPSSRCVAFNFGQRQLAILPFRQAGDDLAMEHYDSGFDAPAPQAAGQVNGTEAKPTPYASSFLLPLTALDPDLAYPVDLAFLDEYREPTLGILSSMRSPSCVIHPESKDCLAYSVFTLDIEQQARTSLLSVSGLPSDLFKLVPLPLPVGGTLLVGGNELIHVDQAGRTTGIAVNEFAKKFSSFSMVDHSDLALRLEHCVLEQLSRTTGDMLMILDNGDLCILSFRLDGRSVSGLTIQRVSPARGGQLLGASASCAVALGHDAIFVGSEDADSVLLACGHTGAALSRKRSHAEMLGDAEDGSDEDISDEDDLYGGESSNMLTRAATNLVSADKLFFRIQDCLLNLSPTGEPTFGYRNVIKNEGSSSTTDTAELVLPVGRGTEGALAFLSRTLPRDISRQFQLAESTKDVWTLSTVPAGEDQPQVGNNIPAAPDRYIITSGVHNGTETSSIYVIGPDRVEPLEDGDFETDTMTLNAGVLRRGSIVVQICSGDVRCYDPDMHLLQIVPMTNDAEDELKVAHSSFTKEHLLVLRHDNSAIVLHITKSGDVEESEDFTDAVKSSKWSCGCLYSSPEGAIYAFLLSVEGNLQVFEIGDGKCRSVYTVENLRRMPYLLSNEPTHRRAPVRQQISELVVCDLGDETSTMTYMILRTAQDDLTLYKAYHSPHKESHKSFTDGLRWIKVFLDNSMNSLDEDDVVRNSVMRPTRLGHCQTVVLALPSPAILSHGAAGGPRLLPLGRGTVAATTGINVTPDVHGLLSVDNSGHAQVSQLATDTDISQTGWSVARLQLGEEIDGVVFHADSSMYVVGSNVGAGFHLPEDDWHHEWANEDTTFRAVGQQGKLKLVDPSSRSVIHEIDLQQDERVMCMKVLDLEISEKTHERKALIAVGTAISRGEDLPETGNIYVLDVIPVVPDPERPETNKALKVIAKEESKGAVTALSDIGHEGFLIAAQGQKCLVRGLKEDNSLLPIAFLDMQVYISSLKCVRGTGLTLMADSCMGMWFTGFMSDPYAIKLFAKSSDDLQIIAAEVLPQNKQLFLLAADDEGTLHVLEFNPEDPKSLSGQRLLTRSTFNSGDFIRSMTLLPPIPTSADEPKTNGHTNTNGETNGDLDMDADPEEPTETISQVLLTSASGALALVTTLTEPSYRRLDALQTHLINILDHPCGLNPRAYRRVESEGFGARGVVDGGLLRRWSMLSAQRRLEACTRVGASEWEVKADLALLAGGALDFLS